MLVISVRIRLGLHFYAPIAQKKEQFRPKEKVEGLNPSGSTKLFEIWGYSLMEECMHIK